MKMKRITVLSLAGSVLAVGGAGAAVAIAATDNGQGHASTAMATASVEPTPKHAAVPTSAARRELAIDGVGLLSGEPHTDGQPSPDLIPPANPASSSNLGRDDLPFARELPNVNGTWLVPLKTGGYGLVSGTGGMEFAPGQLEAGQMVEARVAPTGAIVVYGVVGNGIRTVTVSTAAGASRTLSVVNNTFTASFDAGIPKADRPVAVSGTGSDRTVSLAGILPDGTIGP